MKRQAKAMVKIFLKHISDIGSVWRIGKGLPQLSNKKIDNLIKMGKGFEQTCHRDVYMEGK